MQEWTDVYNLIKSLRHKAEKAENECKAKERMIRVLKEEVTDANRRMWTLMADLERDDTMLIDMADDVEFYKRRAEYLENLCKKNGVKYDK